MSFMPAIFLYIFLDKISPKSFLSGLKHIVGGKEQSKERRKTDREASGLTLGQKVAAAEMPSGQVQGERRCGANLSTQVRK